jgi:hypothetical protein
MAVRKGIEQCNYRRSSKVIIDWWKRIMINQWGAKANGKQRVH